MARHYQRKFLKPPRIAPAPPAPWDRMLGLCLKRGVPKAEIYRFTGMSKELTERLLNGEGHPAYGQGLRIMQLFNWVAEVATQQKELEEKNGPEQI